MLKLFVTVLAFSFAVQASVIGNGDFSSGNSGFSSAYNPVAPALENCRPEGTYIVTSNPASCHSSWASFGDHTSGSGNMMAVNGASVGGVKVWEQTVNVVQDTGYYFSTWIASNYNLNPARLAFSINGASIGVFTASEQVGAWVGFYAVWNSGANTTANVAIVNLNTIADGNDFALDDLSLSILAPDNGTNVTTPEPASAGLAVATLALIGFARRRAQNRS